MNLVSSAAGQVQLTMFETPSAQVVEDHRGQVLQAGFTEDAFEEICCIAEQFDKLRLFNRMQEELKISDRELADFFETKFLKAIHGS